MRERRSPGLRGGGECLAARGSGGGGPRCVTFNRSLLCQRQQRQEGLATESRETVISCVESSRQSESFLGLSLLSGLVYVHACVCVPLSVCAAFPSQGCASQTSPPLLALTPLPLPAPPQKSSLAATSESGTDGRAAAHLLPTRPAPRSPGPAARTGGGQKPTWQEIKHQ